MKKLYRAHRTWGVEYTRAAAPDGTELVILQTTPCKKLEAFPARLLLDVSDTALAIHVASELSAAISKARFFGVTDEAIRASFETVMAQEPEPGL